MRYTLTNKHTGYAKTVTFPQLIEKFGFQYAAAIHRLSVKHGEHDTGSFTIKAGKHDSDFMPALQMASFANNQSH